MSTSRWPSRSTYRWTSRLSPILGAAGALLLVACSTAVADGGGGATSNPPASREPDPLVADPCAHLRGGGHGTHTPASDLGRAHALVRYFGPNAEGHREDAHLADALDRAAPSSPEAVAAYAKAASATCAAPADPAALPPASVTMTEGVAIVVPGTGPLGAIPPEAKAVALDVRALVEGPAGEKAIADALAIVLPAGTNALDAEERTCNGQPDEVWSLLDTPVEQYGCTVKRVPGALIEANGSARPLAVLTAHTLTPLAARTAVLLRVRADALLIGESVFAAIAESTWVGIGEGGIAVRTRRLMRTAKDAVPDVVDAFIRTLDPVAVLPYVDFAAERPRLDAAAERSAIEDGVRPTKWSAKGNRLGDARAALVVAYAATRTFFPYFDVVGDGIDGRLDEALALLGDAPDRGAVRRALARYAEVLHDGHAFLPDPFQGEANGFSPVALYPVGDDLVVAKSSSPDAVAGDVVVAIDGVPAKDRLAEAIRFVSASPHATRERAAAALVPAKATSVVLAGANGMTRTVTLTPASRAVSFAGAHERAFGTLGDLGAPDVLYVSFDSYAPTKPTLADIPSIKAATVGKRGVVIDMRGYPGQVGWSLLSHFVADDSFGPKMFELLVTPTTQERTLLETQVVGLFSPGPQGYTGPVVLLTGSNTQSSAEHLTSFFVSKKRGKVIGGRTSGANGTITGVQLPGGYGFTFTGMVMQHADGTVFHAKGHTPDIEVSETVADLRDGRDTVLARAIAEIPPL